MSVILHEGAISRFFHSEEGELGRYIAVKSAQIATHMHNNLAPHFRSGDALGRLRFAGIFQDIDSLYALVGTDAKHRWEGHADFSYPIALEEGGVLPSGRPVQAYPWAGPALNAAGFRRGA